MSKVHHAQCAENQRKAQRDQCVGAALIQSVQDLKNNSVHVTGSVLNIDVIDNGGGVSAEEAKTVFEKFRRGDRAGLSHGAGLGLPISRAIMRTMGGELLVRFAGSGSSFFRVQLPLAQPGE